MIDQYTIQIIKETAKENFKTVVSDHVTLTQSRSGKEYSGKCPFCQSDGKFKYVDSKHLVKCFSCSYGTSDAVKFVMEVNNWGFPQTMAYLAEKFCIELKEEPVQTMSSRPVTKDDSKSFCHRMLLDSGLSFKDVTAKVIKKDSNKSQFSRPTFHSGTINEKGEIVDGDDVIIEYYDLDGNPVTYERKGTNGRSSGLIAEYFRVRWQFPEAHLDKNGKPFKYRSPSGSGTPIYIPHLLREAYRSATPIPRLFIQEGEKKAEKACKHGLMSFAVSGIQNLGHNNSLPEDVVRIIRTCQVKEVIFLFDSDYNDLSKDKKLNEDISKRPRCFFYAALNFKQYMRALKNQDMYVEIYIGHSFGMNGDKGIDDLLTNTLRGKEHLLIEDIDHLINEKSLKGEYLQLYKITSWSDHRLEQIWGLDSVRSFVEMHKIELAPLPEFIFDRHKWRINEKGELELAQPFDDDEKFWKEEVREDRSGRTRTDFKYSYVNARNFLQNRGFGRYRLANKQYIYIHREDHFVEVISSEDARDYVIKFAEANCPVDVLELLLRGGNQYLGPNNISQLSEIVPSFLDPSRDCQYFYFADNCWQVTSKTVHQLSYSSLAHDVWLDRKKDVHATYLGPLIEFEDRGDHYDYHITDLGQSCHFLNFLVNASNFTWRKDAADITDQMNHDNAQHLLSKLCAIGYMAMDVKDPNVSKAVVAVDGGNIEVGDSNGRSGKSLIGELMRNITLTAYIPGKKKDLLEDPFIWNDVTEKTRLVFIDDVRVNFNFELLFPLITGDWTVNYKGASRVTFPFRSSPKIYIPTNHALEGDGSSFEDRQWIITFSDYYNADHKPVDDFGTLFFSEWDADQWNLVWNLAANCIQLYLTFGVVQSPDDRYHQRKLRQMIGEEFLLWFEEKFSDAKMFNERMPRNELQESYLTYAPNQRKFNTSPKFKKRFKLACEYEGYVFNPQCYDPLTGLPVKYDKDNKPVIDDKSGGVEYFTVGNKNINVSHDDDPF